MAGRFRDSLSDGDGIIEAALVAVVLAAMSCIVGLGAVLLCNVGLGPGLVGLAAGSALCWRLTVGALAHIAGDERRRKLSGQ
jgi:hypothetical protein